jgi:hypothetical protein
MTVAVPHAPVLLKVHCAHCNGAIELECEGLPAYQGYRTYHEYFCPHCRKRNVQITSGAIVSARPSA